MKIKIAFYVLFFALSAKCILAKISFDEALLDRNSELYRVGEDLDQFKAVIAKYGDINQILVSGYTPLILASRYHRVHIVKMLLRAGADAGLAVNGNTALDQIDFFLTPIGIIVKDPKLLEVDCIKQIVAKLLEGEAEYKEVQMLLLNAIAMQQM